jgi:predicted RNase H-like nuclease (RuvC/YqgF family)
MDPNEKTLTTFATRVRQVILRFQELKKENKALHVQLQKDEQEIQNLKSKLAQTDENYNSLKMAKMLEITDGDLDGAKARVSKMIRDVNKCISLLSEGK